MAGLGKLQDVSIIDIRRERLEDTLVQDLVLGLSPCAGTEKTLSTLLLYDERGLKLFERITYLEEYYLTNAEIDVLNTHADKIAARIPAESMLVELGSGNLRKVNILLKAFERIGKNIEYYALDLSLKELQRTLSAVPTGTYAHVKCYGLFGTYDDGLAWLGKVENQVTSRCILTLGSSIGNFKREEAAQFLSSFAQIMKPSDSMLVGLDSCQMRDRVFSAYNDKEGVTHAFYRNGLTHANRLLGYEAFKQEEWEVLGVYNDKVHRHEAFFSPLIDVTIEGTLVRRGERVRLEEAYKYSAAQSESLWQAAGLNAVAKLGNTTDDYHIHIMSSPSFSWSLNPEVYATSPVPTLEDWEALWKAWDTATLAMTPREELLSKPIKLRNACIFYLGHIPTFLDMHLTRATGTKPTEPSHYYTLFERGIDPDVENPENCHAHSEIPDTWPPLHEILDFQENVRARVRTIMGSAPLDRKVRRAMWIGFEHEIMHLETFLYMLLQSDKTLPPTSKELPDWKGMAAKARRQAIKNEWFTVPESKIQVGLDDLENDLGPDRYFGWDIERPSRIVKVPSFTAQARPITNGEYAKFLEDNHIEKLPASWAVDEIPGNGVNGHMNGHTNGYTNGYTNGHTNGNTNGSDPAEETSANASDSYVAGKSVRTVYGPVLLKYALDWPIFASYDELVGFANWMDSRIPTADEVRSIYSFVNQSKARAAENVIGKTISAVNGHLVNDGVEETPPSRTGINGFSNGEHNLTPHDLFADLEGCNIGFQNWHPVPVTQNGNRLSGQGDMGGVWEWTSSPLEKHEGYKPMDLYPAYTADFFDEKHNVVLGGSWATHPRVAGRKTFVNWYQRNYPYAWCGARLVRDL